LHQRNRGITFLDHVISFIIDKKSGFNGLGIFTHWPTSLIRYLVVIRPEVPVSIWPPMLMNVLTVVADAKMTHMPEFC